MKNLGSQTETSAVSLINRGEDMGETVIAIKDTMKNEYLSQRKCQIFKNPGTKDPGNPGYYKKRKICK